MKNSYQKFIFSDIALLELENNVEYRKSVKPACLYSKKEPFDKSQILHITGWGLVSFESVDLIFVKSFFLNSDKHNYARKSFVASKGRDQ